MDSAEIRQLAGDKLRKLRRRKLRSDSHRPRTGGQQPRHHGPPRNSAVYREEPGVDALQEGWQEQEEERRKWRNMIFSLVTLVY